MSRPVRILSLTGERGDTIKAHCTTYSRILELHAGFHPDFIVFPENATTYGMEPPDRNYRPLAEPSDGPSMNFYREVALKYKAYVVGCYFREAGAEGGKRGFAYNTANLLDRGGNPIGEYQKIYPVGCEYTWGIVPGPRRQSVIATEYGPVGIAICFDIGFRETWDSYGEQGARIVFWPSAYPGGSPLAGYAVLNGYYVVTATHERGMRIYDLMGRAVAKASERDHALEAVLDLDEAYLHMDYANLHIDEIRRKYGENIFIESDSDLQWYHIVRKGGGPKLADILAEYKLESAKEYYARSRRDIDRQRETGDGPKYEPCW